MKLRNGDYVERPHFRMRPYLELLAALAEAQHPEHEELTAWAGGAFDAEAFDLDQINRLLARSR